MNLENYFSEANGLGILSTADDTGKVNSAIYARPHFLGDNRVSFIMRDRLTRSNLKSNPHANFMFVNQSDGLRGLRINLQKVSESSDQKKIDQLSRRMRRKTGDTERRYLVSFKVEKVLSLLGGNELSVN